MQHVCNHWRPAKLSQHMIVLDVIVHIQLYLYISCNPLLLLVHPSFICHTSSFPALKATSAQSTPPVATRSAGQTLGSTHSKAEVLRMSKRAKRICYTDLLNDEILTFPRTHRCFELIENDDKLDYDLPRKGAVAGQILNHCYTVLDAYLQKWQPMTFKVGYTHCAYFRFYNPIFGYSTSIDKWERMVVVYAAAETISPSFVEAAMIEKFKCNLLKRLKSKVFYVCVHIWGSINMNWCAIYIYIYMRLHLHAHVQSKAYQDAKTNMLVVKQSGHQKRKKDLF